MVKLMTMLLQVSLFMILLASSGGVPCYITPSNDTIAGNNTCFFERRPLDPCSTLETLAANCKSITSDDFGVFLFLPGNYVVQNMTHLNFTSSQVISLSPYESGSVVRINCDAEMTITFRNISIINIRSLEFFSCGGKRTRGDVIKIVSSNNTTVRILDSSIIGTENGDSITIDAKSVELTITRSTFDGNNGHVIQARKIITANITKTTFMNNYNRTISIRWANKNSAIFITSCTFSSISGTALFMKGKYNQSVRINSCTFLNNSANASSKNRGVIHLGIYGKGNIIVIMNSSFHSNKEEAITYYGNSNITIYNCSFIANTLVKLNSHEKSVISLNQSSSQKYKLRLEVINTVFLDNTAFYGGAIFTRNTMMYLGNSVFSNNTAENGGAVSAENTEIHFYGDLKFISNKANIRGGAIMVNDSSIHFQGNISLINNSAISKGGVLFLSRSFISMESGKTDIVRNRALYGGTMYAKDSTDYCYNGSNPNFLRYSSSDWKIYFKENTALKGSILYGSNLLRNCNQTLSRFGIPFPTIASDTMYICFCNDERKPNCSMREKEISAYRGQLISFKVTTLTRCRNFSSSVISICEDSTLSLNNPEECYHNIHTPCKGVSLHINSRQAFRNFFILKGEGPCKEINKLKVSISFQKCPPIFPLPTTGDRCECDKRLGTLEQQSVIQCDEQTIRKKENSWFGYKNGKLEICNLCPLGYCTQTEIKISEASLNGSQCVDNRSGVVCGMCEESFSVGLGSSRCIDCSKKLNFLWQVPLFAVMGLILVLSMLFLDLTVSIGLIDGLIFYANILSISGLTNNYNCSIHPLLSVFISWVNMDFGIETCFYSGMDMYEKTWLQFAFPLYIWLLVGLIIIFSHYSTRVMTLLGRKVIPVLATLFLLSYLKVLRIVVKVLNITEVLSGDADNISDELVPRKVWTHDGNVDYISGKHIPLFIVALLFLVVLFLPYTLLLTFGQCLRSLPRRKGLRWLHSTAFISIMDAYHTPFNRKHRYWTGLLLLIRCILLIILISISYIKNATTTNIFIILIVNTGLLIFKASFKDSIYINITANIFENVHLLNLVALASLVLYFEIIHTSVCYCLTASISVALTMFMITIVCHMYYKIRGTDLFQRFLHKIKIAKKVYTSPVSNIPQEGTQIPSHTTSYVELREALLESAQH